MMPNGFGLGGLGLGQRFVGGLGQVGRQLVEPVDIGLFGGGSGLFEHIIGTGLLTRGAFGQIGTGVAPGATADLHPGDHSPE